MRGASPPALCTEKVWMIVANLQPGLTLIARKGFTLVPSKLSTSRTTDTGSRLTGQVSHMTVMWLFSSVRGWLCCAGVEKHSVADIDIKVRVVGSWQSQQPSMLHLPFLLCTFQSTSPPELISLSALESHRPFPSSSLSTPWVLFFFPCYWLLSALLFICVFFLAIVPELWEVAVFLSFLHQLWYALSLFLSLSLSLFCSRELRRFPTDRE